MPHELRWNPIYEEWVILSPTRIKRLGKSNPFASDAPEMIGKKPPIILPNKYPNFIKNTKFKDNDWFKNSEPYGVAEVLVESAHEEYDFHDYSIEHILSIINLLQKRTSELSDDAKISYVHIFKNKGTEVGSSIKHPHMQIYGMPYVPPVIKREVEVFERFYSEHKCSLLDNIIKLEKSDGRRVIFEDTNFISFVPYFARWPYECLMVLKSNFASLLDLGVNDKRSLSLHLKKVAKAYHNLFSHEMAYVMLVHQAPFGMRANHYRFFIEFQPIYHSEGKLKYTAGIERLGSFEHGNSTPEKEANDIREALA
jgi:UDPglucose--hexose-1-phosphate uridylyltransferase